MERQEMNRKRKVKVVIFCIVLSVVVIAAGSSVYITKYRDTEKYEKRDNVVSVTMQEIAENTKWQVTVETFRVLVEKHYSNTNRNIDFEKCRRQKLSYRKLYGWRTGSWSDFRQSGGGTSTNVRNALFRLIKIGGEESCRWEIIINFMEIKMIISKYYE